MHQTPSSLARVLYNQSAKSGSSLLLTSFNGTSPIPINIPNEGFNAFFLQALLVTPFFSGRSTRHSRNRRVRNATASTFANLCPRHVRGPYENPTKPSSELAGAEDETSVAAVSRAIDSDA